MQKKKKKDNEDAFNHHVTHFGPPTITGVRVVPVPTHHYIIITYLMMNSFMSSKGGWFRANLHVNGHEIKFDLTSLLYDTFYTGVI